eukprot:CAMPEP_0182533414 /NCGR_PEP_ID=MMETSP1323-20130603/13670_1 /TAXON_ID=236787 /ORGANISM="Florenciella parvula, Strain RCC1693" /LENGTH=199 /DNA_ID=CAMNT_0024743293 /DNA_START=60 /DNA_END=659 /DNA_ORIENTATION=+
MAPQLRILVALLLSAAASGFLQSSTRAATMGSRAFAPSPLAMAAEPKPLIKGMSAGMGLIKPIFTAEAQIQGLALGAIGGVGTDDVRAEIDEAVSSNKVLIYTYALSPFSTEALSLLDSVGYEYTKIELGLEWFALGPNGSQKRRVLGSMVENGATSLPKIFIGGTPLGGAAGYSALAESIESGELEGLLKKSGAKLAR